MSNKSTAESIARATDRKAVLMVRFESTEDFEAVTKVEKFVSEKGYKIGSMCCDEPMACSKKASFAKWHNIDCEDWSKVEAMIVSDNMRNGPVVECYEFV